MEWWPYLSLFGIAFLAATIFHAQSELVLVALIAGGRLDPWLLVLAATSGNVLGSVVNRLIGRFLHGYREHRWFPIPARALERPSAPIGAGASGRCSCPGSRSSAIPSPS
ncbi:MAG TPA: hypothetical protein VF582_07475 [Allosphingosinicella sp.]